MELVKKEKVLEFFLWGIVAYAVAILTYFTFKIFNYGEDSISAFGSVLSAVATFFAAYVAVMLFTNWKEQHNKTILAEEAKIIFKLLNEDILVFSNHYTFVDRNLGVLINSDIGKQIYQSISPLLELRTERLVQLKQFANLANNSNIDNFVNEFNACMIKYHSTMFDLYNTKQNLKVDIQFRKTTIAFVEDSTRISKATMEELKNYILLD